MNKEQFIQLWQDNYLEEVYEEIDDSWRHGNNMVTVFKDEDGRYWEAHYRVSGDGEYHGIRDNEFEFFEVKPVKKVVEITEYVSIANEGLK